MGNIFSINWPEWKMKVEAEIIDGQDAVLRSEFWSSLPFNSIQSHAACAGVQMYCPFRLVCRPENPFYEPMNEQQEGRISLELDFQYLSINYGPMAEPVPALPIAQVQEQDIDKIKSLGKMAWHNLLFSNQFIKVDFKKKKGVFN